MPALRSPRGQSTLEYVGVVTLVATVLLVAAPLAGAPDVGRAVAAKLRLGLCLVAHDVCTTAGARASGLEPCVVDGREEGRAATVTFTVLGTGLGAGWTGSRASDGSFTLVHRFDGHEGVTAGVGVRSERGVTATAGAELRATGAVSAGYRFADEAALRRFLAFGPVERLRAPVQWRAYAAGAAAEAAAKLAIEPPIELPLGRPGSGGRTATFSPQDIGDLAAGRVAGFATAETRVGPGDELTITGTLRAVGPSGTVVLLGSADAGASTWSVALTRVGGVSRRLVLRRESTSRGGRRAAQDTATLDLGDPADRAVADALVHASPRDMRTALAAALTRAEAAGRRELAVYDVADSTSSHGVEVRLPGLALGVGYTHTKVARHLVTAKVRDGSPAGRERFDCLSAARAGGRARIP